MSLDKTGPEIREDGGWATPDGREIGEVVMEMNNITLKFCGLTAISDISFVIRKGEIRSIIDVKRHQRLLSPARGPDHLSRQSAFQNAPI